MTVATILIVDDEPANLAVLTRLLRPTYRVRAANSGERVLPVAASDPKPDLILLDVMMPDMNGYEVLARLKGNPATRDMQPATGNTEFTERNQHVKFCLWAHPVDGEGNRGQAP